MSNPKIPGVSVAFSNGNLLQDIAVEGVAAMVGTAQQPANQDKVFVFNNLTEAEQQGITQLAEPFAWRQISEFYAELGGNGVLWVMLFARTVEMNDMVDVLDSTKAAKLIELAQGKIGYLGVFRTPQPGYIAGNDFFDQDVAATALASKAFVEAQNKKLRFLRVLIEGRVANESSIVIFEPGSVGNGFAGVVAGGTRPDGSASVGMALGRKVKYAAHIKLGKVANGPLTAQKIYIGSKELNAQNALVIPAVAEVRATSTITITAVGVDGNSIWAYIPTSAGWIFIGSYVKVTGDATVAAIATAFAAAINATQGHSYTAAAAGAVITVTAPAGSGDTLNGTQLEVYRDGGLTFTRAPFANGVTARPQSSFVATTLHEKGYISFLTYPNKAGFYFGVDHMASRDDYRILAHGAVIDEAARIVAATYLEEVESEVDMAPNGTIPEIEIKHLQNICEQQVLAAMSEKISGVQVFISPNQNLINVPKLKAKVRVQPKGYLTFIEVDLGLTAATATV